jgi:hypothetical protein
MTLAKNAAKLTALLRPLKKYGWNITISRWHAVTIRPRHRKHQVVMLGIKPDLVIKFIPHRRFFCPIKNRYEFSEGFTVHECQQLIMSWWKKSISIGSKVLWFPNGPMAELRTRIKWAIKHFNFKSQKILGTLTAFERWLSRQGRKRLFAVADLRPEVRLGIFMAAHCTILEQNFWSVDNEELYQIHHHGQIRIYASSEQRIKHFEHLLVQSYARLI